MGNLFLREPLEQRRTTLKKKLISLAESISTTFGNEFFPYNGKVVTKWGNFLRSFFCKHTNAEMISRLAELSPTLQKSEGFRAKAPRAQP
jgi:hypothetical protein